LNNRAEHCSRLTVKVFSSFDDLPDSYHQLSKDMASVNFSSSLLWFRTFQRTALQEGAALRLYGIESAAHEPIARGLLVAQTPAARRGSVLRNRRISPRTLSGMTGYQTYLFAPLLREADPDYDEILHCLARHLRSERPRWEMIDFAAMDRDARSFDALVRALSSAGFVVRIYHHFFNVFERTPGVGYAAYLSGRPPSARKHVKNQERQERQLKERFAYRAELITGETGLEQTLKDYAALLAVSWKEPDYHPDFVPACIRASAKAASLRLLMIYLDDKPAATWLVFVAGKRAVFYRTAYDPAYASKSVGRIATSRMVQHLLDEDHVEELDFGRDREAYKKYFASSERVRCGALAFNCTTFGGLRGLAEQLLFELRGWLGRASRPLRARLQELRERRKAHQHSAKKTG
jgi:Acetyltransferase (GNAT) domain